MAQATPASLLVSLISSNTELTCQGLLSAFTKALASSPFPSPLGAEYPPSGRYEGAVLGIGVLGVRAIRKSLFGIKGEKLDMLDNLLGVLYPGEHRKSKTPLMKLLFKYLSYLINPKPAELPAPPSQDELTMMFGPNIARALEKRPWMAHELARLQREGEAEADADGDDDRMDTQ
jgi:transcription initiation factor TFIID subunit 6